MARSFCKRYGVKKEFLNEENILMVPGGTSFALSLNFEYLCRGTDSKGEIIILSPFFGPYLGMAKLGGAKPILVETDKNF
jgi:aspartate/methionine/tyrosine aminotransferase